MNEVQTLTVKKSFEAILELDYIADDFEGFPKEIKKRF